MLYWRCASTIYLQIFIIAGINVMAMGNFSKLKEVEGQGLLINKNKTIYIYTSTKKGKESNSYKTILSFERSDSSST